MRKVLLTLLAALTVFPVWASDDLSYLLNKVVLRMSAEKWVTTNTALVTVDVNMGVADRGVDAAQIEAKKNLAQLSDKSEWHIVSLHRNTDRSGLESIEMNAQARLTQDQLSAIRTKAEALSKPGEKYKVQTIEFTPSQEEIRQAQEVLREDIYKQVNAELVRLNKLYPKQAFYVHEIDFLNYPEPFSIAQRKGGVDNAVSALAMSAPQLEVGNKLTLTASVILGSMTNAD